MEFFHPFNAILKNYDPSRVVEILSRNWAYPATIYDAYRLEAGKDAELVVNLCRDNMERVNRPKRNPVNLLRGCDIVFRDKKANKKLIEMLHIDQCFVSSDPISTLEVNSLMNGEKDTGLFMVFQLTKNFIADWSCNYWSNCFFDARPHEQ